MRLKYLLYKINGWKYFKLRSLYTKRHKPKKYCMLTDEIRNKVINYGWYDKYGWVWLSEEDNE